MDLLAPVCCPVACCPQDSPLLADDEAQTLALRFKALADPTRVRILNLLARAGEQCVCVLADEFPIGQPTMSHHLRLLREAGLVEARRRGTWAYYRVSPGGLSPLFEALRAEPAHAQPVRIEPRSRGRGSREDPVAPR